MPKCTYCGGTDFYSGPEGGMSVNILCANPACRHWFNYTGSPFNTLDDLNRVEPTAEERQAEQRKRLDEAAVKRTARFAEGADAYRRGRPIGACVGYNGEATNGLRTTCGHGSEPIENIDRLVGYMEAMAQDLRLLRAQAEGRS